LKVQSLFLKEIDPFVFQDVKPLNVSLLLGTFASPKSLDLQSTSLKEFLSLHLSSKVSYCLGYD
jgi:hypothetical protein